MSINVTAPELNIEIADILIEDGEKYYRIIHIDPKKTVYTAINIFTKDSYDFRQFTISEIYEGIYATKKFNIVSDENYSKTHPSCHRDIDENHPKYIRNKAIIERVVKAYGPDYMSLSDKTIKPEINAILNEYGIHRSTLHVIIRTFLQSGLRYRSLMPKYADTRNIISQKRRGRKTVRGTQCEYVYTEEDLQKMLKYVDLYMHNRAMSIRAAYDDMNDEFFRIGNSKFLRPESQRPTYEQFRHLIKKVTTFQERREKETSPREVRNDKRVQVSDSTFRVKGAGDLVEIDEMSLDFSCCMMKKPDQNIGRYVVYLMVDVYTRLILAMSVGVEDNSVLGVSNLFLNIADDKKALCQRYGINFDGDIDLVWPSNILPLRYRCDKGSEYLSNFAEEITLRLDISQESVPAATGSLKPNVEQKFNQLNSTNKSYLKGAGLIEKRHDSDHKKTAVLNIWDATRLIINFVLHYNQLALKNYPNQTQDMIERKLDMSPASIWKYSMETNDRARRIIDKEEYRKNLMPVSMGSASKKGVCFKGRYYMDPMDEWQKAYFFRLEGKSKRVQVRYDPRDNKAIFVTLDRNEILIPMNLYREGQKPFCGLSFAEDEEIQNKAKETAAENRGMQDNMRANRARANKEIVKNAKKRSRVYAVSTNMKENRKEEKENINRSNSVIDRIMKDRERNLEDGTPELPEAEIPEENMDIIADEDTVIISDPIEDNDEEYDAENDESAEKIDEETRDFCEEDDEEAENMDNTAEEEALTEEDGNSPTEDDDEDYYEQWLRYNQGVRYL